MAHPIDFKNCTSSCKEGGHRTYGECLRSKGLSTAAGETTRASGPTKPNDALTAKGAPKRREPCPGVHSTAQALGRLRCTACGYVWIAVRNQWVAPEVADADWFPCAQHDPTADPSCPYCTTTTRDMVRATTNPDDLRASAR